MRSTRQLLAIAMIAMVTTACSANDSQTAVQDPRCDALLALELAGGVVERVEAVAAGTEVKLQDVPVMPTAPTAFCRVHLRLKPTPDSDIRSEVWLPTAESWNGKFLGLGNGGFGGAVRDSGLVVPLQQGYASATSDLGHEGSPLEAGWAYGQPERVIDWAHRANHLTAVAAKQVITAFYASAPSRSYFHGCSDGGREALMEAARYPEDYDGIVVGAPAAAFTDLMGHGLWSAGLLDRANLSFSKSALVREVARSKLGMEESTRAAKLRLLENAALARCDAIDGVKDGLIENPRSCPFQVQELLCRPGQKRDSCLDADEVEALQAIYTAPRLLNGEEVSSGFPVGGEAYSMGWNVWLLGPVLRKMGTEFFRWMVYEDRSWSRDRFDFDRDVAEARTKLAALINSDTASIEAFVDRGGKLVLYHGWSDPALPAGNTIKYYERLQRIFGEATTEHARLFMAPGMAHCFGGHGPNIFDAVAALDGWVDAGTPPERIIATKYENEEAAMIGQPSTALRSRPLCPWPQVAKWDGKGSIDEAASFACVQPE